MSKLGIGINKLEAMGKTLFAFGKKNASTLMTGGGILLGWAGVYVFWKESRKAEKKIREEEIKLNSDKEDGEEWASLDKKEKLTIYLQYCWVSLLMGLGSTGLSLYSQKLNLDEIAKYVLLSQMYKDKTEGLEAQILKEKDGEKKLNKMKQNIRREKYPAEEVERDIDKVPGTGRTLFIDVVTGAEWKGDILDLSTKIAEFNDHLKSMWTKQMKKKFGDAFYVSDNPYPDDMDFHVAEYLSTFLQLIGETDYRVDMKIGEAWEFRVYSDGELLKPSQILDYERFKDPDTGIPVLCYIDYFDFLAPTSEMLERYPY